MSQRRESAKEILCWLGVYVAMGAFLVAAYVLGEHNRQERLERLDQDDITTCIEEEPCWDCETMGDGRCANLPADDVP